MVRPNPINPSDPFGSTPLAIGLFVSVSALVALCAKQARRRVQTKYTTQGESSDQQHVPRSPLMPPKQLITTISSKAIPFMNYKKEGDEYEPADHKAKEEGFGEGGLWQKAILMGEKCQPPEFSGVIYYDPYGNQVSELPPRSPRASHLPSFSFPIEGNAK